MLDTRLYYAVISLVHLLLILIFWSWSNVQLLVVLFVLHVGIPGLHRLKPGVPDYKSLGEWAVVTGSTDGLGKAYAFALAKQGINIVLNSFDQEGLDKVQSELYATFPMVQTKILAMDFTDPSNTCEAVSRKLEGLEVGILINNVGMVYPNYEGRFLKCACQDHRRMLLCNVDSVILMTHAVLPQMCSRKRGLIINMGALGAVCEPTDVATYNASKAWVNTFTRCMAQEMAETGVRIVCVNPGYCNTHMLQGSGVPKILVPTADEFVSSYLKVATTLPMSSGMFLYDVQGFVIRMLYFFPTVPHIMFAFMMEILRINRTNPSGIWEVIKKLFWFAMEKIVEYKNVFLHPRGHY